MISVFIWAIFLLILWEIRCFIFGWRGRSKKFFPHFQTCILFLNDFMVFTSSSEYFFIIKRRSCIPTGIPNSAKAIIWLRKICYSNYERAIAFPTVTLCRPFNLCFKVCKKFDFYSDHSDWKPCLIIMEEYKLMHVLLWHSLA